MNSLNYGSELFSVCMLRTCPAVFPSNMKVSLGDKTKTNHQNGNKEDIHVPTSPLNRKDMQNLTVFKLKKHSNQQFATLKSHSHVKWQNVKMNCSLHFFKFQ